MPTAMPVATTSSAPVAPDASVHPGKVVWLVSGWGNERFDNIHVISAAANYMLMMHAKPIAASREGKMIPGIAASWSLDSTGLAWSMDFEFEGVKFHDGSDMAIEDVLWTFQHNWDKSCLEFCTNTGNPTQAQVIDLIEQTGPNQITLTTNVIDAGFVATTMSELATGPGGIHPRRSLLYDTEQEADYDKSPIMAGPMRFVEHTPGSSISMQRFDDYYFQPANGFSEDRRATFTSLDLLLVPEEATRVAALRAGEADIAPLSLETRSQLEAGGGRLVFGPEAAVWRIVFPHAWKDPSIPFNDKRVRRALSHAIDKELIMERLYGGSEVAVVKGWGPVTPGTVGYSPDLDPLPYDPDLARQLLVDAGYPNGEGFGKVIVNTYPGGPIPFLPESAQVAAEFWRSELNLDVEVNVGDDTTLNTAWRDGNLQGEVFWRDNETRRDASGIARAYFGRPDFNRVVHSDPDLFEVVQGGIAVFDPATREQALNGLYKRLADEQQFMSMGYLNLPWGVGPRVKDWQPLPLNPFPNSLHTIMIE